MLTRGQHSFKVTMVNTRIFSPMTEGNGAIVAHRYLESAVPGYVVKGIKPVFSLFGPALRTVSIPGTTRLIHSVPDLACFFQGRGLPSVVSFQNYVLDSAMARCSSTLQRTYYRTALRAYHSWSVRGADVLTAVSQFTADIAKRDLGIDKEIEVIHNCVDHRMFTPAAQRSRAPRLRILFSGNPTMRKGIQYLPAIAQGLPENAELLIASGLRGDRSGQMTPPNVLDLGPVPFAEMPELYRSVDLCIAPFFREGLCLSVLEAMSSGLPVVAFDASSMPELIVHGKGGYLTPVGDVPAMLAAIDRFCDQPTLLNSMGDYNRELIEAKFTLDNMRSGYRQVFDRLLV